MKKRSAMAVFPADVVTEILSRLPVKPLLLFRSVCKIWCALIDSDHFIKLHLHRSIETKNNRKLLLITRFGFHSTSLDSLDDVPEKLDYPLVTGTMSFPVAVRSCNGLLLVWKFEGHSAAIWNPSTLKFIKLPLPEKNLTKLNSSNVGFGYDAVNDDYKVVSVVQWNKYPRVCESDVKVYSLKSNSWRTLKDFPYFLRCSRGGVLAHGALHWFLDKKDVDSGAHFGRGSIVAFDLASEETRLVSLPEVDGDDISMDMVAWEGCLCIIADLRIGYYFEKFMGVWVMKGESWNILLSESQLSVFMGSFCGVLPLAYSKNGREVLLLLDNRDFFWFDLEHNKFRKIQVPGLPIYVQAKVFVQSLVPLGSGGKTNQEEQNIQDKKIEMKRA